MEFHLPGKTVTNDAVNDLLARGYTVYRTPAHNSGFLGYSGVHYTYTNAVIVNDMVFIPEYGGSHATDDAEALGVYESAMPDHDIVQVDCADAIEWAGAIHCCACTFPLMLPQEILTTAANRFARSADIHKLHGRSRCNHSPHGVQTWSTSRMPTWMMMTMWIWKIGQFFQQAFPRRKDYRKESHLINMNTEIRKTPLGRG